MTSTDERPSNRLRIARESLGLTQQDIAEALGMTVSGYRTYETGAVSPPRKRLEALERLYRVRPEWVLKGDGEMMSSSALPKKNIAGDNMGQMVLEPPAVYERRIDEFAERYRAAVDLVNEVLRLRPLTPPPPRLMVETLKTIALRGVTREEMLFLLTALEEYRAGAGRP